MKSVIWIDDRKDNMLCVVRGTFPSLWENGIVSKVVFLSDNISSNLDEFNSSLFSDQISDMFFLHYKNCENKPIISQNELENLEKICQKYENELRDVYVLRPLPENAINEIISFWNEDKSCKDIKTDEVNNSISGMFSEDENKENIIPSSTENLYMLDVVLLNDDYKRLTASEPKPVLSIALYHYITKVINAKCILYSQYTYNSILQDNWKKLYKELYNGETSIEITPRTKYYEGSMDYSAVKLIINHF